MNLVREYPVGPFICHWTLTIDAEERPVIVAAWEPQVPTLEEMTEPMWQQYRNGRGEFMDRVAEVMGGTVGVVEVSGPVMNGHG